MIKEDTLDPMFRVLHALNLREIGARHKASSTPKHQLSARLFLELVVFPFCLALTLAFALYLTGEKWLTMVSLTALLVAYFGILIYPLVALLIHRSSAWKALKNPFSILLTNARMAAAVDQRYIRALRSRSEAELRFLKFQVDSERAAFEKRLALVVGSVEKVGVFPGFLAIAVVLVRLGDQQPDWVYAVAYATPALYVMGAMSHFLLMRLERQAGLVKLVLDFKKESSNKGLQPTLPPFRRPRG